MKTKLLLICIALLSCSNTNKLDMEYSKKRSFKFINKISSYNRNINYNCFRSNKNKSIIFLLSILLLNYFCQYFYNYSNINLDANNFRKLDIINYINLSANNYKYLDNSNYTELNITNFKKHNNINYTNNTKSEIENFNNELFCPIINLEKNQEEYRLLSDIKYNQFKEGKCNFNDPNEKLFIIENICDWGGLFANLGCLSLYFSDSLLLNRKFLIKMKWKYTDENSCDFKYIK